MITDEATLITQQNSAIHTGIGLLETILVEDNFLQLWGYHWERLQSGLRVLKFNNVEFSEDSLKEEILKTAHKNGLQDLCRIRLQVFYNEESKKVAFFIECFSVEKGITQWNEKGLKFGIAQDVYKLVDAFSNLKTNNLHLYKTAQQQIAENGWDDALILNEHKRLIESTIANIFWIKDEKLFTVPLSEGCIAGTMRKFLIEQWTSKNIKVEEKTLMPDEIKKADEVFITNAIRKIKWIAEIEGKTYSSQKTKSLYKLIFT